MKKIFALLLALAMVFSLAACGSQKDPGSSTPENTAGQTDPTGTSTQTEPTGSTVGSDPTQPSDEDPCTHELEVVHTQNSTCTEPGLMILECTLCGYETTQESTALGHSFSDATCTQAKICTVCGVTEGEALGHSYTAGKCDRCGAEMPGYEEKPSGCNHNYKISRQKAPTCTEKGSFTYTCSVCGDSYIESIDANGHKYADATCDKPQTCSVCSATEGKALGHSYSNYRCTRCGTEDPNKPTVFTVTVRSDKGKTVANVTVTLYVDGSTTPTGSAKTGSNGKATIPVEEGSSYKVVLSDIPVGLKAKESYSFTSMTTNLTLTTVPVYDPLDHSRAQYKVGDTMVEFTLTDIDGNTYKLSELLQEKKMIILNFWYVACNPCKAEFPYFNEFYAEHKDEVELLAMTPYDTEDKIRGVQEDMELLFPVMRDTLGMSQGFGVSAYPTTVVITSDGVIRVIKSGKFNSSDELLTTLEKYL